MKVTYRIETEKDLSEALVEISSRMHREAWFQLIQGTASSYDISVEISGEPNKKKEEA